MQKLLNTITFPCTVALVRVRISAIVDGCFKLIVDGVSAQLAGNPHLARMSAVRYAE